MGMKLCFLKNVWIGEGGCSRGQQMTFNLGNIEVRGYFLRDETEKADAKRHRGSRLSVCLSVCH